MELSVRYGRLFANPVRLASVAIAVFLGVLASWGAFSLGRSIEEARRQASFEQLAGERIASAQRRIQLTLGSLHALASFFDVNERITAQQFQDFVRPLLAVLPGVQALEWAPLVPAADRQRFEGQVGADFPNFQILQLNQDGRMISAGARERYFPVLYIAPLEPNREALGFDLASQPTRLAALDESIRTRAAQATGRVNLVQEKGDQFGFLVFLPVFKRAEIGSEVLEGSVLGVFRIGDLIEETSPVHLSSQKVRISVWDVSSDVKSGLLFPRNLTQSDYELTDRISVAREFDVAGRRWKFVAIPGPAFTQPADVLHWVLLCAGLLLTAMIAWILDSRFALEEKIVERTFELQQARDEAQAATKAKSAFLATMSHDVRTPLTSLIASADLIDERQSAAERQKYLHLIRASADQLLLLIDSLLNYASSDLKVSLAAPEPFSLRDLIEIQLQIVAASCEDKPLLFTQRHDDALPPTVVGHKGLLAQILMNLLSNAAKYTDEGAITVIAELKTVCGDDLRVLFCVRDMGPGIPEHILPFIFEPFTRGVQPGEVGKPGYGLGLSIAARLAEGIGGSIWVESETGKGSAFFIEIPLKRALAATVADQPPRTRDGPDRKLSILLADDSAPIRTVFTAILKGMGHSVEGVANGREALDALQSHAYDLVLIDIQMPIMDGYETIRHMRRQSKTASTPVIVISGFDESDNKKLFTELGVSAFLRKPVPPAQMRRVIEEVLS